MFPLQDNIPSRKPPIATILIITLNGLVFAVELSLPKDVLEMLFSFFGLVPARLTAGGWWLHHPWIPAAGIGSFLTSLFLHGGWMHILSNMWILWIFGDNVEDRMGTVRFVLFYLLCGVLAGIVHILVHPNSTLPTIGASGAVAGVLGAYFLLYPAAQVVVFFPLFLFWPIFFVVPAFLYLGVWFLMQFFNGFLALLAVPGIDYVAWWAHIGGFLAGVILHPFFLASYRPPRRAYIEEYGTKGAWWIR